jgi:hypothetical protein
MMSYSFVIVNYLCYKGIKRKSYDPGTDSKSYPGIKARVGVRRVYAED